MAERRKLISEIMCNNGHHESVMANDNISENVSVIESWLMKIMLMAYGEMKAGGVAAGGVS
jgi:hypothetical protein